jgi:SulP family sulfate permease
MATANTDSATSGSLSERARAELRPSQLIPALMSGVLNGALEVALAVSFAALVFSGELAPYLSRGIGMALFSATIGVAVVALLSSYRASLSANQDVPAAIVALAAAAVAAAAPPDAQFATVAVVMILTTLAAGLLFLFLGIFRLTGLVRFLPYPVIGGFLAGTGWLLFVGGIGMMAGWPFSFAGLGELLALPTLLYWLPGVLAGALILFLAGRVRHHLFLPLAIVATLILFYLVAFLGGAGLAELSDGGWLLGPFPSGGMWQPLGRAEWARADASAVWPVVPNLLAAVVISAIALLLNATGLELSLRRDLDLNREMRGAGWANLVAGLGGGFVNYHALSLTMLNARLGATGRLSGLMVAAVSGVALLFGGAALGFLPKMVFGALLVFLGLSFLWEWVVAAFRRLPRIDYAIVLGILVIIAAVGFLQGVAVGVVAAVVMFVVSYSRSSVVKHELDGTSFSSRVIRNPQARALLADIGEQAYYLQLQGFIFFGTAYSLLEAVRIRVRRTTTRHVVLDFRQVIGLDSTALLSFEKLRQLARDGGFSLTFAGLPPALREQFNQGSLGQGTDGVRFAPNLDRAAEWVEDQLCIIAESDDERPLDASLQALVPGPATTRLIGYLNRREVSPGTYLMHQGDAPDVLYFIESGQVTAQLEQPGRELLRLETMRGGRMVGELGFYLGTQRSAAIVVDRPTVVYVLTQDTLTRIERDDPAVAHAFHRLVVHLLGERVLHLMWAVEALQA